MPQFCGLKLSQDAKSCVDYNVNKVTLVERSCQVLVETPGIIGCGSRNGYGNSGFQTLNIAVQFGAKRIALVGFDMQGEHWHGRHPSGLNNPRPIHFQHWRAALDAAADDFASLGVVVINTSPISTLTAYPVMTLKDAIRC